MLIFEDVASSLSESKGRERTLNSCHPCWLSEVIEIAVVRKHSTVIIGPF